MRPAQAEVGDAGVMTDANDVLADLIERPDPAIDRGPEHSGVLLRLLRELGDRFLPLVRERDVEKAAELDLGEAWACGSADDVELPTHAPERDALEGRGLHPRPRPADRHA